jgi:hypothetical protein
MSHDPPAGVRIAPPGPPVRRLTDRAEREDSMTVARIVSVAVLVIATVVSPASAQTAEVTAAVTVPIEGRFARGGEFMGTATINRFEQRGDSIVAVGVVTGTLRRGNRATASVVATEVRWSVVVSVSGMIAASSAGRAPVRVVPARFALAQAPCPTSAQIALGGNTFEVGGVTVSVSPMTIDLTADPGEPLGNLLCQIGDAIRNVADLVGVLNGILALLTTLLGSVTGLVGGIVP